ncbi:MAG: hypothetical protein IPG34_19715 [Rhodocyclaceae bacterium]|nr:hypothetical protein [Rhodocyclaceae bacterium]
MTELTIARQPASSKEGDVFQNRSDKLPPRAYGQGHPSARLTDDDVDDIRTRLTEKSATQTALAIEYRVSQAQISRIKSFKQRKYRSA